MQLANCRWYEFKEKKALKAEIFISFIAIIEQLDDSINLERTVKGQMNGTQTITTRYS